jgi:hypothetical protein
VNSAGGRSLVSAGMPQSERDLLFCEVLLSRPKNRLLSGVWRRQGQKTKHPRWIKKWVERQPQ